MGMEEAKENKKILSHNNKSANYFYKIYKILKIFFIFC